MIIPYERIVEFAPAYDRRGPDPSKNYGVGAVKVRFLLKGAEGAVQFVIGTTWYLPEVQRAKRDWQHNFDIKFDEIHPTGWDLGYHADSLHPIRPWHKEKPGSDDEHVTRARECAYTASGRCYYDGSTLNAIPLVKVLLREGGEGIWRELEKYYDAVFHAQPADVVEKKP